MKYYTIEEAAKLFSNTFSPEWLLKQMIEPDKRSDGLPGSFITPSWYCENPILLMTQEAGDSLPGWFSGWFEIDGLYETGRIRNGEICFDSPARYLCLSSDNIRHIPRETIMIPLTELCISQEELECFAGQTGRKLKLTHDVQEPEQTDVFSKPVITVQKIAMGLRREYYTPEELVEYWRDELEIDKITVSLIIHHVNNGNLKESLRYEWSDGRGWFFEDYPDRTHMIDECKTPPVEKYYIRHSDAEHFVRERIRVAEPKPLLPVVADKSDTASIPLNTPASKAEHEQKPVQPVSEKEHIDYCLEQNKNAPLPERIYYLRINTKLTANQIGAHLGVSHDTPKCKSRKVTVGKLFKEEALRLGTWEQVKRKNGT